MLDQTRSAPVGIISCAYTIQKTHNCRFNRSITLMAVGYAAD